MREKDHVVALLHGELPIEERARIIQDFKDGVYKILITTNVCARGKHILVVNSFLFESCSP